MDEEKEFYVTYRIEGRYVAKVLAKDLEEALDKAEDKYCLADFGVLPDEYIDGEPIIVEDQDGNFVWEK